MDRVSEQTSKNSSGIFSGVVVSNNDPLGLGRIKVRIPHIHKPADMEGAIPDEQLPWVSCALPYNRYVDVGCKVYIDFESRDFQLPICVGFMHRNETGMLGMKYDNGATIYGGEKFKVQRPYSKWDKYFRDYISDSRKGDIIYNEHEDEKETIGIVDRIGNWLKFVSPVTREANKKNSNPSLGAVFSKIKNGITGIFFRCVGTALLQMIEKEGKSEIILKAGKGGISITDKISLTIDGKCSIELTESTITLSNSNSSIQLNGGNITITNGSSSINLSGGTLTVNGGTMNVNAQTNLNSPSGGEGVTAPININPIDIDKQY